MAPISYRSAEIEQLRVTTPHTIESGEIEVALVPSYLDFGRSTESEFLTEIEFGVLDSLLLELEVPFRSIDQEGESAHAGLADIGFGAKYQLPKLEALDLHSAIGAELSLPTGDDDRGLGKGDPVFEAYLSLQRDFGRWTCVTDFFIEAQNDEKPQLEWNGAVVWRPSERPFFAMLGINVELEEFESGGEPETSLVPGLEYKCGEYSCGLGVPIGLSHDAQDLGVILLFEFDL